MDIKSFVLFQTRSGTSYLFVEAKKVKQVACFSASGESIPLYESEPTVGVFFVFHNEEKDPVTRVVKIVPEKQIQEWSSYDAFLADQRKETK